MEERQIQLAREAEALQELELQFSKTLSTIGWTEAGLSKEHRPPRKRNRKSKRPTKKSALHPIDLRSRQEKLADYEKTIERLGHRTEPELTVPVIQNEGRFSSDDRMTFDQITKLRRDLKRRRMKYRTTKTPPLSYTEEIRGLIGLQMESWQQYVRDSTSKVQIN